VVLDEGYPGRQEVFHLDLCVGLACDSEGNEFALVSSLRKAREILEEHSLMPGSHNFMARWIEANGYEAMSRRSAVRRREQVMREVQREFSQRQDFLRFIRVTLDDDYQAPMKTLIAMGKNLSRFLAPENYDRVQPYLDLVKANLEALGIEVLEVPALLWRRELNRERKPVSTDDRDRRPIYAPACGVVYNRSTFITAAGIRLFDEAVRKIVETKKQAIIDGKLEVFPGMSDKELREIYYFESNIIGSLP